MRKSFEGLYGLVREPIVVRASEWTPLFVL